MPHAPMLSTEIIPRSFVHLIAASEAIAFCWHVIVPFFW